MEGHGLKGPMKQRKGIVQMYTASVQQIGRTFWDKGEKEWKELRQGPIIILTLNKFIKPIKCTKLNNTISSTQNKHDANIH